MASAERPICHQAKRRPTTIAIPSVSWLSAQPTTALLLTLISAFHFPGGAESIAHDSLLQPECLDTESCPDQMAPHIILKLVKRDDAFATSIAADHDMIVRGEPFLDSHYFLEHRDRDVLARRKREIFDAITQHSDVHEIFEDMPRIRKKRDGAISVRPVLGPLRAQKGRRQIQTGGFQQMRSASQVPRLPFPDPLYNDQWYLIGRAIGGYDMNVREAWLMGYAGRNVSVSILDDGIQRDHPDIEQNYDPLSSTDINDHDNDPTPQNNGDNKHGTRCAGEVAAVAGNNVCGVGIAFLARIGGVRMLDGPVSDSVEAASLNLNQQHIDIYSASWGPEDDGKTFDGPGNLAQEAFYRGVKTGRGGKGNIFVWASGNGGSRQDSCSADGYTTSIYTLSISSATFDNHRPWYLEECPSTIATTYSSANINQPAIVTVDVPNGCTKMHTGTSASAPIAAGIIALALEANPSLTWRDVQHITLRTANPVPLLNNDGWSINGVGRRISNKFGYGLMDAGAVVKLARVWTTVPEQHMCTYEYLLDAPRPRPIMGRFQMNFSLEVGGCQRGTPVLYLEHVHVIATIRFAKRGDLKLTLYSPAGTRSVLLPPRPQDTNQNGFHKWPFLTVQMWGEDSRGVWTLMVESVSANPSLGGMFSDWSLILYGTEQPAQPSDQHYAGLSHSFGQSIVSQAAVQASEEKSTITFGDLRSAPNCHPECHGCTESNSSAACFACKHFTQSQRNRNGFKCVDHCDEGFYAESDKCKKCSTHCQSCSEAEVCITCHGAKLLVDVQNHYGHFDHGKCVDACPHGLVPDYSYLVQARCVIKKNPCSAGYYESIRGICLPCDNACSLCHGPGVMACDQCAVGYGNKTMGFCRPCCKQQQSPPNATTVEAFTEHPPSAIHQCEVDCQSVYRPHNDYWGANNDYWGKAGDTGEGGFSLLARFVLVTGGAIIATLVIYFLWQVFCFPRIDGDASGQGLSRFWRKNVEYTPLKTAEEGRRFPFEDDTSSDEGESYELCLRGTMPTSAQLTSTGASTSQTTNFKSDEDKCFDVA